MKKLTTLSTEMYNTIANGKLNNELRNLLGISEETEIGIGDTMVMIGEHCKPKDVFEYVNNGKSRYYVVIESVDNRTAYCYVIYGRN